MTALDALELQNQITTGRTTRRSPLHHVFLHLLVYIYKPCLYLLVYIIYIYATSLYLDQSVSLYNLYLYIWPQ